MKETRLRIMAGEPGFEPGLRDSESRVLPLDDSPKTDVTESKFRPLASLPRYILPLILPRKIAGIGQLLQSQLPNPRNPPIIPPHPADINAPYFRHGSLVPVFFFPIYRLIQRCLSPSPFLFRSRKIEGRR